MISFIRHTGLLLLGFSILVGVACSDTTEPEVNIEAIRIDPEDAPAYFARGNSFGKSDQFEKAIDDYTEAIRINPEYSMAYFNRGISYARLGQIGKADADKKKACELDSKYCN